MKRLWYMTLYRPTMKLMHLFNLHHCPPSPAIEPYDVNNPMLWCQWCGLRGRVHLVHQDRMADISSLSIPAVVKYEERLAEIDIPCD